MGLKRVVGVVACVYVVIYGFWVFVVFINSRILNLWWNQRYLVRIEMHCVVSNCDLETQSYMHRFPRSSFLYERWRQAIELGTGDPFPRDVDPLEVVICQKHFTGFDGYQEPALFLNTSLDRQTKLESCRLCLKIEFSDQITTGCWDQIVVQKTVGDLLRTVFGMELSDVDRMKGICKECLDRFQLIETTLMFFSKKQDRWLQMQNLILGESVEWHGKGHHANKDIMATEDQVSQEAISVLTHCELDLRNNIKLEIDDPKVQADYPENNKEIIIEVATTEKMLYHNGTDAHETHEDMPESTQLNQCSSCQTLISDNADYNRHCRKECEMQIASTHDSTECTSESGSHHGDLTFHKHSDFTSQQPQSSCDLLEAPTINTKASPPFICQICSKSFARAVNLQKHQAYHQKSIRVFTCQYCTKQFQTRKSWKIHETLHENTQAYTCDICLKSFTHPSNMKRHQQLHVGFKEFGCEACGKRFSRHTHLIMHQLVHTGEKPYECPKCAKKFSSKSGLAKHRRAVSCRW